MKYTKSIFLAVGLVLILTAAAPRASAQAEHVRWDITTVTCPSGTYPCTINNPATTQPTPTAVAMAMDCALTSTGFFGNLGCSTITLTGSGTFVVPAGGGPSSAVTGGGTWSVTAGDGTVTSGTFAVTELIQFQKSEPLVMPALCGACETTDNIGVATQLWGGIAVVRVTYSDRTTGVITMACSALADPPSVAEGITATKGVLLSNVSVMGVNSPPLPPPSSFPATKSLLPVLFFNPGFDQYTVEFHVN